MTDRTFVPNFSQADAKRIADDLFGDATSMAVTTIESLPSYVDQNFALQTNGGRRFVLKIANASEIRATLELQNRVFQRLATDDVAGRFPRTIRSTNGRDIEVVTSMDGRHEHMVRLVSWLDGRTFADVAEPSDALLRDLGTTLAGLDRDLADLTNDVTPPPSPFRWDLAEAAWTVGRSHVIDDPNDRELVEHFQLQYLGAARPRLAELPRSLIHNDANDHNLLVSEDEQRVTGVLDFGDMIVTPRVFELAIAGAYAVMKRPDAIDGIAILAAAYDDAIALTDVELEVLLPALAMRLVVSVVASSEAARRTPENDYLRISQKPAFELLRRLRSVDLAPAETQLRAACGKSRQIGQSTTSATSEDPIRDDQTRADHHRHDDDNTSELLLERRRRSVGSNLSIAYDRPLTMLRGRGQFLFDHTGRA